ATIGGTVTANNFTKFGPGTLAFSGTNRFEGTFSIEEGAVQFNGATSSPISGALFINDGATLDLNAGNVRISNLSGNQGAITNSGVSAAALNLLGNTTGTFLGR